MYLLSHALICTKLVSYIVSYIVSTDLVKPAPSSLSICGWPLQGYAAKSYCCKWAEHQGGHQGPHYVEHSLLLLCTPPSSVGQWPATLPFPPHLRLPGIKCGQCGWGDRTREDGKPTQHVHFYRVCKQRGTVASYTDCAMVS